MPMTHPVANDKLARFQLCQNCNKNHLVGKSDAISALTLGNRKETHQINVY